MKRLTILHRAYSHKALLKARRMTKQNIGDNGAGNSQGQLIRGLFDSHRKHLVFGLRATDE